MSSSSTPFQLSAQGVVMLADGVDHRQAAMTLQSALTTLITDNEMIVRDGVAISTMTVECTTGPEAGDKVRVIEQVPASDPMSGTAGDHMMRGALDELLAYFKDYECPGLHGQALMVSKIDPLSPLAAWHVLKAAFPVLEEAIQSGVTRPLTKNAILRASQARGVLLCAAAAMNTYAGESVRANRNNGLPVEVHAPQVFPLRSMESRKELEELVDQLQVQLAGCGVAALGGVGEQAAEKGAYGWSPAYQDVKNLREDFMELYRAVNTLAAALLDYLGEKPGGVSLGEAVTAIATDGVRDAFQSVQTSREKVGTGDR